MQGNLVNSLKQAETFATYLAHSHWKAPAEHYKGATTPISTPTPVNMQPITIQELKSILTKVKNNKAPGPDLLPAEAFKWLEEDNLHILQETLNLVLLHRTIPTEWQVANVIEIYKGKGAHTDPEMYRPISLLSTAYKILARILQTRLAEVLDHKLRPTQYGFRKNRSCSQPLHIVRRLQDKAEKTGATLYLMFLDWEKAFDKIHPEALIASLRRYGVTEDFVEMIINIYSQPLFTVTAAGTTSQVEKAQTGIRQGCPLSPYLFLVVHSAIMHDVEQLMQQNDQLLPWVHSANHPLFDLAYADDTVLMGQSAAVVERALHHVQNTAEQYNLKLNLAKCEYMSMNAISNNITFTDGTQVKRKQQVKYLGAILTADARSTPDVRARIAKATAGLEKLNKFWQHTDIDTAWKIKIYIAVFIPMILYGMESAHLTPQNLQQLDTFHYKAMRKIYKIKTTYYTQIINPTAHTYKNKDIEAMSNIPPLSQTALSLQFKFLGHILRCSSTDLEQNICFTTGLASRAQDSSQRRGRPREHWLEGVSLKAWKQFCSTPPCPMVMPQFHLPMGFLQLHRIATDRVQWRQLVVLPPTSRA